VNTLRSWSIHEADVPVHGDQKSNISTGETETKCAFLTAVYQQPVVEEHGARADLGQVGRNTETTNQEGLCCR